MSCGCDKNQTHEDVHTYIEKNSLVQSMFDNSKPLLGVGLFLIPAPEVGILELKSIHVDNLSYSECVKRGQNCEAFKWIPHGMEFEHEGKRIKIKSADDLKPLDCTSKQCNSGPVKGCSNPCFCYSTDTYCHK